ncbi:MAG: hypothetical protein KDJ97_32845 [Anaerolineae bacterium]|nr:hypothetical protein [Anaerolineae bacterium]
MKKGRERRLFSTLSLFLAFVAWSLILTFPLILHPFNTLPLGDESVGTVPFFNLWTLQWNIDQLTNGYPNYWDAPIFAPNAGAFAFSEIQPLTALLAAPIWLATQSPALAYNFVVILFLTLNGWFACWLLRSWGVTPLPALLGGLLMQSLPFVAQEMGVLQLSALFGFLWWLLFMGRLLTRPTWRNTLGFGLGGSATFLTCGYYGLFSLIFLPLALLFQIEKKLLTWRLAAHFAAGLLITLVLTGPVLWGQYRQLQQYGFTRPEQTIENNSARLADYLNFLDYNVWYGRTLGLASKPGQRLFPGLVLIILAGVGLAGRGPQRVKAYLVVATILALLLSLGLRLRMGDLQPYQWVRAYLPGFEQLRSPFRLAAFVQIHLALLAGFGLWNLERWGSKWAERGQLIIVPITIAALIEMVALPLPLEPLPPLPTAAAWQNWLNQQDNQPGIVMLPFAASPGVVDFEPTTIWMLENRTFQGRMVNGYSGFFPPGHAPLREEMSRFPTDAGLDMLRELGVDYIVVHNLLLDRKSKEKIENLLPLIYHDQRNNISIYTLN